MKFFGRQEEVEMLRRWRDVSAEEAQFVVITGRRRVGKTALIREFIKDKEAIFFTGIESSEQQNLENLGVMQDVASWIIERNNARDFPEWEGGEVVAIVPTLSGYPISMGSAFARYQIQIKVTYRVTEGVES